MIRRPPRSTLDRASAASDVYKRQRQDDTLSRYGGEEFALILPGTTLAASRTLISRLKDSIAAIAYRFDGGITIQITASIGVASYYENATHFQEPKDLIKAADYALSLIHISEPTRPY